MYYVACVNTVLANHLTCEIRDENGGCGCLSTAHFGLLNTSIGICTKRHYRIGAELYDIVIEVKDSRLPGSGHVIVVVSI